MSKPNVFADVHCHSLLKYFHNNKKNVWRSIGFPNRLAHLLGFLRYSSADFRRMALGGVQVAFVVLTPVEQKTFYFKSTLFKKYGKYISSFLSRLPGKKIEYLSSSNYDQFDELKKEYAYYLDKQNQKSKIRMNNYLVRHTCQYKLLKSGEEINDILTDNARSRRERTIATVLTLESFHGLGCGHVDHNGKPNPFNVSEDVLLQRVDTIKGVSGGPDEPWTYSPIWITLAHGFNNNHFGHSQSLTEFFMKIFDYGEPFDTEHKPPKYVAGINEGISDTGKKVIKRLLNIDEISKNRQNTGKRILIDTKHMSTRSRQEYYDILDDHLQNNPMDNIPIVMSHAAVNGKLHLSENNYNPADTEEAARAAKGLNPWSINLYDDEIIRIHKSSGFIGLVFYEPLLAGGKDFKSMVFWGPKMWADLFGNQIEHIVKTIFAQPAITNKKDIWKCIGLGTDFDGQLNPADRFSTAKKLPSFKKYLKKVISEKRFDPYRDKSEIDEIMEMISYKNVVDFVNNYY